MGENVLEPFSRNSQVAIAQPGWPNKLACSNFNDLIHSDGLFAKVNGSSPDEGVMVELVAAISLGKPTFLFRDDLRKCCDSDEYPLNLMIFMCIPHANWHNYFYRSLNEIDNEDKAIYKWLEN